MNEQNTQVLRIRAGVGGIPLLSLPQFLALIGGAARVVANQFALIPIGDDKLVFEAMWLRRKLQVTRRRFEFQ